MKLQWVLFVTYGVQHIPHKSAYGIFNSYEDAESFAYQYFDQGQYIVEIIPLNTEMPESATLDDIDFDDTEKVVSIKKNQEININFSSDIEIS
jgi:hypothetical protein